MKKIKLLSLVVLSTLYGLTAQNVDLSNGTEYIRVQKNGESDFSRAFGLNGSNHMYIGSVEKQINNIYFYNKGTNHLMTIEPDGNVGIGITNPDSKLDISGKDTDLSILKLRNTTWVCNQRTAIEFWNGGLKNHPTSRIVSQMDGCGTQGEALMFDTQTAGDDTPSTKMTIKNNGNIGIGTVNPGSWKLAVNGQIRAKEIKVETGWSDFVFYDSYKLPTLSEVEDHIKAKGHLKDIPSAQEVEENGILLGEMDSKLLQKIEELTLYAINQEKKIKVLEKQTEEIKELKSLVKQLLESKK